MIPGPYKQAPIPTSSKDGKVALDPDTYLSRTQEHRHEVPEPCAQPHQQPEGPQEPRPEAECAQRGHFPRAHCQDDSRGDLRTLGLGGRVEAGLGDAVYGVCDVCGECTERTFVCGHDIVSFVQSR